MTKIFTKNYRIYYEDTDAGGVVYYANYLKFFERARTDFLRQIGINQQQLAQEKQLFFMVKKCQIDYLKPAKLDDLLEISVKIEKIGGASIKISQQAKIADQILTNFSCDIVFVDGKAAKPAKIPAEFREKLLT